MADAYVSCVVDPLLARSPRATLSEVRRLQEEIGLPNLLFEIPATEPGLLAIEDSIAAGYSVAATLVFSLERYAAVAESYLRGSRRSADAGLDLRLTQSVASFPMGRLDSAADKLLVSNGSPAAMALRGRLGIATARLAYDHFRAVFSGPRWEALRARGATPQRLVWVSSSRDPASERLGQVPPTSDREVEEAIAILRDLGRAGIDLGRLTHDLEDDSVARLAPSLGVVGERTGMRSRRAEAA